MKVVNSLILAFCVLTNGTQSIAESPFIEIHGHRGARAVLPENTIPALQYAIEVGVDVLEFDLAVTKDDHLVLSHNPHIDGHICVDKNGNKVPEKGELIRDLTLVQVQSYDCGALQNPRFKNQSTKTGTKIPSLDEVFEMLTTYPSELAKTVMFNIETKIYPESPEFTVGPTQFAKLLYASLQKHNVVDRTVVQSFDFRTLIAIRLLDRKIKIAALLKDSRPSFTAVAKGLNPNYISPNANLLTNENISIAHFYGVKVVPWTVNEKDDWDRLIMMGVDGIITDDPQPLVQYMESLQLR
ncbi:MAG: glycerophosphodiester phosphodiesterase [Candidatus Cloacimonetes bacterium]|nr:glycerophosphodiester phosphodiesterase [Candidatus Cloacimonadota bacterium]